MELTIELALQQGVDAHKKGNLKEAERRYNDILKAQPAHPDANHNLGLIAVTANKVDLALLLFKAALDASPAVEQFWLSYIDALIKENQLEIAITVLEQGRELGLVGEKVDALEFQVKQITKTALPKLPKKQKGLTLKEKRKKIAQSKQQKKQAKDKSINSISPSQAQLNNLLELYQGGRYFDAENLAVSITRQFPEHQLGWKVLGVVFSQTGKNSKAVNANQKAVKLSPQDYEAYYNLGNTLKKLTRLDEAEASYRQAIGIKPDFVEAQNNLGSTLQELGKLEAAEKSFRQAIALKPDYDEAHYNLGNTLKKLGRLDEAEVIYRQLIAIKPHSAEAQNNLAGTLQELGKFEEAEKSFRQAIAFKPDYDEAHNNLGVALLNMGRLEEAEISNRQAIALKPDFAAAYSNLANTLKELGRLEEAEASNRQAIALKPGFAAAHSNLANTLEELGRLEEASASYTQAIELKHDFVEAARNFLKLPVGHLNVETLNLCEKAFNAAGDSQKDQAHYFFSQGNLLKHKGFIDQSFNAFCKANKLKFEEIKYQVPVEAEKNIGSLMRIKQWTPSVPVAVERGLAKLFIMGPSRSGKSLLEHMLKESRQVKLSYEGGRDNELTKAFVSGKDSCKTLFEDLFIQSEDELLSQDYKVITSTNPSNIFYSDYLLDILPNTYFLIIKRDLRDVASEIFTTEYSKANFYSYRPNEIEKYLGVYNKIGETLALKVPNRCITVSFEEVITAPEDTVNRIGQLVASNFETGNLKWNPSTFISKSLFRDHFAGMNK